jgi:hypothetical protein
MGWYEQNLQCAASPGVTGLIPTSAVLAAPRRIFLSFRNPPVVSADHDQTGGGASGVASWATRVGKAQIRKQMLRTEPGAVAGTMLPGWERHGSE